MTRCSSWHQFSDEPLGHKRQCVLDDGHEDRRHLDSNGRWWETYTEQPAPVVNTSTPIIELVLADFRDPIVAADLRARAELGRERYGVYLQAHNGRDALRDAYEEALDLLMYLRQAVEEESDALVRDVLLKRFMEAIGIAGHLRHLMAVWSRR